MSTTSKKKARRAAHAEFDKYFYYLNSVQAPENDVRFMRDTYRELRGKYPFSMREDFCGTHALSCEWVKLNSKNKSYGIDLDLEPILYGQKNYASKLTAKQRENIQILQTDVLNPGLPKADIICSMNFSQYTLANHIFTGAGVELTPKNFKFSAMYGQLKKAVEFSTAFFNSFRGVN